MDDNDKDNGAGKSKNQKLGAVCCIMYNEVYSRGIFHE